MIFLVINWIIIFFISGVFGNFLINITINKNIYLNIDKGFIFILSQILGLLFISNILLVISIIYPINYLFFLILILSSIFLYLFSKDLKLKFNYCFDLINQIGRINLTLLIGLIGLYQSQTIFWGDSAIYHINSIKWINEYGMVFGIANLIKQLGFASSWFALNASIQLDGKYSGLSYTVLGGYVLLLMVIHFLYCVKKISVEKKRNILNSFYLFAYPLIIILIIRWGVGLSPSPDMLIHFMGLLAAGLIISDLEIKNKINLIFLSAVLLVSIKLSSISLIFFSLYIIAKNLNYLCYRKILLICLLIAPILVCNFINSGYPLYPFKLIWLNVEWLVPQNDITKVNNAVFNHAFYNNTNSDLIKPVNFQDIVQWALSRKEWLTSILIFLNLICILFLIFKTSIKYINLIIFVLISFIIFVLNAPTLRFGLNWLIIIPAITAVIVTERFDFYKIRYLYSYFICSILIAFVLIVIHPVNPMQVMLQKKYPNESKLNFILPSKIVPFENVHDINNLVVDIRDLKFSTFKIDQVIIHSGNGYCWDISPPCSENLDISLINPEKGINGGFKIQKK